MDHKEKGEKKPPPAARITQQFREANNMTYELDCAGSPLIVRIFPIESGGRVDWRLEVRTTDAADAIVAKATASSRAAAFDEIVAWWRENGPLRGLATYDWAAVATAMTAVRAI